MVNKVQSLFQSAYAIYYKNVHNLSDENNLYKENIMWESLHFIPINT